MKKLLLSIMAVATMFVAKAEEGMWLPSLIGQTKLAAMQKAGLKLSAEELYSSVAPSLKDAIVNINGCTGEIISEDGLFITNHHCGYGQIQFHSSQENDYLTNGFTAMNKDQELPCNNYSAKILVDAQDVTSQITAALTPDMSAEQRKAAIEKAEQAVVANAIKGTHYEATVEPLYYANQYFLFVYERFTDIRLVVAPPSAVGKFGGDTDNWMWPRHTGDFAMFRIYKGQNGKPAPYSKDNVPYKPLKHFKIDARGTKPGDFSMVYGYPGRTNEYLFSDAVSYIGEKGNPAKIALRTSRLKVMNQHQSKNTKVRIQYAAKNASVANAWKKWQGEELGIKRTGIVGKKQDYENRFATWAKGSEFESVVPTFKKLYGEIEPYAFATDYYNEAFRAIEVTRFASTLALAAGKGEKALAKALEQGQLFYKNYSKAIDQEIAQLLMASYYKNIDKKYLPELGMSVEEYVNNLFAQSRLTDEGFMNSLKGKSFAEQKKAIQGDAATKCYNLFSKKYNETVAPQYKKLNSEISALYESYMKGMMEFEPSRLFYPDANSTLRIAYGAVEGFTPRDGVTYKPYTTLDGVIAKDNPEIYDYNVPQKLRDIYNRKDYGRWEVNGTVPVAFLASNHTTGGNSGSPVVSAEGHLIGTNFDRCWESTMSDVVYDRDMCRNIAVDVRYILFLTEKLCGAGYLLDEMDIIQ